MNGFDHIVCLITLGLIVWTVTGAGVAFWINEIIRARKDP
jgi:hypothetical protein